MVSFALDIVKFLLIYRYLQNIYWFKREASIMKAEGVTAGVADVILLIPSSGYASLCLEFKTQTGRQQDTQKAWQKAAETAGNKYTVIRSFDEFRNEVTNYLQPKKR